MFQLLKASLLDHDDRTSFSLLFANNTPDDVLLRRELDDLAKEHPSRFKVGNAFKGIAV
jgi:ferredoxin-NADP reductase